LIRAGFHCCGRDRLDLVLLIDVQPEVVLARLRARPGTASRLEGRGGTDRFGARLDAALRAVEQIRSSLEELAERGQRWMRLAAVDEDAPQGGEQTEAIVALVCRAWKADTGGQTATCGHRQPSMAVRP
jgi:thymidylate kinase